jgi:phage/plasmid-associated DNA primase
MSDLENEVISEKIDLDYEEDVKSKMMTPKQLVEDGYTIMNVRTKEQKKNGKILAAKSPIKSSGYGMKGWEKMLHDVIVAQSNYDEPYNVGFGIRLGKQENGKLILSLDFDCCKKIDGDYVDCYETLKLLGDYRELVGNEQGMFSSSTEGNKNVLIDYTNSPKLKEAVEGVGKNNICRDDCGLELLFYGNQVIPPTATKCKKNGCDGNPREYLTDTIFKVVDDDDPAVQYIIDYIGTCKKIEPPKKKKLKVKQKKETEETDPIDEDDELLDMVSVETWDDYHSWKKLVWVMKDNNYSRELAIKYSRKSDKYDKEGFDNIWDNAPDNITLTQGTINYYAKKGNPIAYEKYIHNKILENKTKIEFVKNKTDKGFAETAIELLGDDIVFTEQAEIFVYYKRFWRKDDKMVMYIIQKKIIDLCNTYLQKLYEEQKSCDDEEEMKKFAEKIKEVSKTIGSISTHAKLNSVLSQMKISLMNKQQNIRFDAKTPNIFCFNNIAFDLDTGEEYDIKKEDYITMRAGYDYEEPTEEAVALMKKIFEDIFPKEEMRKTYISILRSGLSGERQEKLFMANGGGRNGKGLLNELMMETVGNYGQKLNMCVITDKIKGGANAEVSNLHKKRWVVANEPNDDEVIKAGNIKRLTGDERIDARGLYQDGKNPTILNLTFVIELNKMIALQGRIDDAIVERLVKVDFTQFFTSNELELKNNPNAKKGNPEYKKEWWKEEHKHAFFKYLLSNPNELYICDEAKNSAKEYLLNNDDMYNWFIDNYEKVDNPSDYDYVSIKDIYELWKESDLYSNMSKANKRKANMKHFKQSNILENNEMKKYYVEEYQKYKDGKRIVNKKSVLVNWKKKTNCKINIDSDEE